MVQRTAVMTRVVRALTDADLVGLSDRDLLMRFANGRDHAAFAALVARHTEMVLGVCRRTLPQSQDMEDVCQAVFLLLAQKAGRVCWQASIAGWLYTAARKVAHNARIAAERRVKREGRAAVSESVSVVDMVSGRELMAALDEELEKLPARYREPLVLCYLEGLMQDEAAARLGVGQATLKSQLKRGRKRLAAALNSRGYELGVVLLASLTTSTIAAPGKLRASISAAVSGSPSTVAANLARTVTASGLSGYKKMALTVVVCLGAAIAMGIAPLLSSPNESPKDDPKPVTEKPDETIVSRIGTSRFRASHQIDDARYSSDGKRIVGCTGSSIYVWDASDGSLIRTINTKLAILDDPTRHYETDKCLAFAVNPRQTLVACGGTKEGKTYLQIWDFDTGKAVAETGSNCEALKVLAWTPDGEQLLERTNAGWEKPTAWKLIVRNNKLEVTRSHELPEKFGDWNTVVCPLPGNKEAILWQQRKEPTILNLESGEIVRTLPHNPGIPSGLGISPDGQMLAATSTNNIVLFNMPDGNSFKELPVLRKGWEKPRPLFSPDSKTVYVWDHRPIAYDVATAKEKWKATSNTIHSVQMKMCDVSPDGSTLLVRHDQGLSLFDTKTGIERNHAETPATPTGLVWSPDGRQLFTRTTHHDRTWTAWDGSSGKRLYDLQPTGFGANDDWKMLPDLFFINGGKEIAACLDKSESTERAGAREFLIFDALTGQCKGRLGEPLPDKIFQWTYPIGVDPSGTSVLMQWFAVEALPGLPGQPVVRDQSKEISFKTIRWDPVKQKTLQEWVATGNRFDSPRHYAPYCMTISMDEPNFYQKNQKPNPAKIRCYSPADGKLIHQIQTDFSTIEPDRVQGNMFLTMGYESNWVNLSANRSTYKPHAPFVFDLWELPSRGKVRLFEMDNWTEVVLGPGGRYVVRVIDDNTFEIHEPYVLKTSVMKSATSSRPRQFEFSPDGRKVAVSFTDTSVLIMDTSGWRKQTEELLAKELPGDLTPLLEDLTKDTVKGLRAARLLSVGGDKAVALLGSKIEPKKAPDEAKIKQSIVDLDSVEFATREKAEKDLREMSILAESHLRKAIEAGPSPEARQRILNLLKDIENRQLTASEKREVRAVQALEWMDSDAARRLLAKWASGDPNATLTKAAKNVSAR